MARHLDGALRGVVSLASARLGARDSLAHGRDTGMVFAPSGAVEVHGERMMDWIRSDKQWRTMAPAGSMARIKSAVTPPEAAQGVAGEPLGAALLDRANALTERALREGWQQRSGEDAY